MNKMIRSQLLSSLKVCQPLVSTDSYEPYTALFTTPTVKLKIGIVKTKKIVHSYNVMPVEHCNL